MKINIHPCLLGKPCKIKNHKAHNIYRINSYEKGGEYIEALSCYCPDEFKYHLSHEHSMEDANRELYNLVYKNQKAPARSK